MYQYKEFPYTLQNGITVKVKGFKLQNQYGFDYWINIDHEVDRYNGIYVKAIVMSDFKIYGVGSKKYQGDITQIAINFDGFAHSAKDISKKSNKVIPFKKKG